MKYRYPRTLDEAFGPHTSKEFAEDAPTFKRAHVVAYLVCVVAVLAAAGAVVWRLS